ncbi:FAD/NAD(P)-binding protein [Streptomonospora sp. PA3]|uniref:FAD/NAD(P)-binding protein n=1 Tax=Streptomonospora sp. PA3 TaxID=2607326 RepID=UPI0012DE5A7E|nr:FAD/NAD(P)-binding protein [Streptomonospora sp. PA3]MUL43418.1 FAD/NAD(P)-binding protein [Streptomonospora sp. PA3]
MGHAAAKDGGEPAIAFVGGGAGAALAAIALLRATTWLRLAYRILLIDEHGRFARGRPYSGAGGECLLEIPVKHMSALPDRPCHLMEWVRAEQASPRRAGGAGAREAGGTALASPACGPETLLPRRLYGDYLADTLAATAAWASPYASLHTRADRAVAVGADGRGAAVRLASGERVPVAAAVVATGDPAVTAPPPVEGAAGAAPGAGLAACSCGALTTPAGEAAHLFAVGAVRRGEADATVPRIREQAEALAQRITDTVLRTPPGRR